MGTKNPEINNCVIYTSDYKSTENYLIIIFKKQRLW